MVPHVHVTALVDVIVMLLYFKIVSLTNNGVFHSNS